MNEEFIYSNCVCSSYCGKDMPYKYSSHLNIGIAGNSNGRCLSGCQMALHSNGGLNICPENVCFVL